MLNEQPIWFYESKQDSAADSNARALCDSLRVNAACLGKRPESEQSNQDSASDASSAERRFQCTPDAPIRPVIPMDSVNQSAHV